MEACRTVCTWAAKANFRQYKRKNAEYELHIDESGLAIQCQEDGNSFNVRERFFKPDELVGCVCMKAGVEEPRKHLAFFTVYAYPLASTSSKKKKRTRIALTFEVDKEDSYEKNLEIASNWRTSIYLAIRKHGADRSSIDRRKRLLLLVNPNSGPGKAHQIYKRQVASILGEAEVAHEVVVTKASNHALELVKTLDLSLYSGLVIVSGDGLLYEIYNGLLARNEWEKAIEFPVGVIPGGSGNGLARSLAHYLDEPYMANPVLVSTLNLAYGYTSPMDLVLIQTPSDQKLSFLSIGLGLLSDIDIESERLRSIGETRFTIWALARIANMRRYHAKVSFKRSQANISNNNHNIRHILRRSQTVEAESELGRAGLGNQMIRSQSAIAGEDEFCPPLMKADPCSFNEDDHLESRETTSLESTDNFKSGDLSSNGRSNYLQPKLQEPVPEDWETIEDDFVILYACYQTHMGSDIFLAPEATLNDGVIWLLLVRGHATKASITKFLLAMDGSHVNIQGVEMFPVEAFRIEPSGKTGYLTVDGEKIQWGPLQAQILPSKGNIITR